jgi:hypothetical protein
MTESQINFLKWILAKKLDSLQSWQRRHIWSVLGKDKDGSYVAGALRSKTFNKLRDMWVSEYCNEETTINDRDRKG